MIRFRKSSTTEDNKKKMLTGKFGWNIKNFISGTICEMSGRKKKAPERKMKNILISLHICKPRLRRWPNNSHFYFAFPSQTSCMDYLRSCFALLQNKHQIHMTAINKFSSRSEIPWWRCSSNAAREGKKLFLPKTSQMMTRMLNHVMQMNPTWNHNLLEKTCKNQTQECPI